MFKKTLLILLLLNGSLAYSSPAWYQGTINRVWTDDPNGGFVVTYSGNTGLSDCRYGYVYFRPGNIQPDMLKNSLNLALSAFHAGSNVGIVIDKELNGEYCHAMSIDIRR